MENEKGQQTGNDGNSSSTDLAIKKGNEGNVSPRIRSVRFAYGLLAAGYFVCVVLQVFFAGLGLFVDSSEWQLHRAFANYFEFGSILMFLLTYFGRIRGGLRWYTLGLFVLTTLQHLTVRNFSGPFRALHPIDALLLFWISLHLMKRSWLWLWLRQDRFV